jgi:hypothetical protein
MQNKMIGKIVVSVVLFFSGMVFGMMSDDINRKGEQKYFSLTQEVNLLRLVHFSGIM